MALINCPECQKEISTEAKSCPNCGYVARREKEYVPVPQSSDNDGCMNFIIVVMGIIGVILMLGNLLGP